MVIDVESWWAVSHVVGGGCAWGSVGPWKQPSSRCPLQGPTGSVLGLGLAFSLRYKWGILDPLSVIFVKIDLNLSFICYILTDLLHLGVLLQWSK